MTKKYRISAVYRVLVSFEVSKTRHTATDIRRLDEAEEVSELARILGGVAVTENVINSAREMKKLATDTKIGLKQG